MRRSHLGLAIFRAAVALRRLLLPRAATQLGFRFAAVALFRFWAFDASAAPRTLIFDASVAPRGLIFDTSVAPRGSTLDAPAELRGFVFWCIRRTSWADF